MDLREFSSGTKANKGWLSIVAGSIATANLDADTFTVGTLSASNIDTSGITADIISLRDTAAVPNPPIGEVSFFSTGSGYKATDPLGGTVTFLTDSGPTAGVQNCNGPSVVDHVPRYCDTSGNMIEDSGVSIASIVLDQQEQVALTDQTDPLAPSGLRDLWQYTTGGALGPFLIYDEKADLIHSTLGAAGIAYSNDGGATFLATVPDVPYGGEFFIMGTNGTVWTAVSETPSLVAYSSADGINFSIAPALPTNTAEGFNIDWFAAGGLFITGVNVDAAHRVMTSPDGINWTVRVSNSQANRVKSNSDRAVSVGQVAPFGAFSLDGISWISTGLAAGCRSVGWSEDRKEWLAIAWATGEGFVSPDGVAWTSVGVIAPLNVSSDLLWVDRYQRWYLSAPDSSGNYSLWSTTDPTTSSFVSTHLDGSVVNPLNYSTIFMEGRNSFGIGVNNSPYVAVSTARNSVKALTDDIRVRGRPVSVAVYNSYDDVKVDNTVAETTLITASALGSMLLQASQPIGMRLCIDLNLVVSSVLGDNLTIRYKAGAAGATLLFSHILAIPALSVNLPVNISTCITVRNGAVQVNSKELLSGAVTMISSSGVVYDRTIGNLWNLTAQWGANVNQCTANALTLTADFINGA